MLRTIGISLLALAATTVMVCWSTPSQAVAATEGGALADMDGDFLPDCVEWAVMTSITSPDTDGDQISDFVEVVQRGRPRQESPALPLDQEMRLVVTGPQPGSGETTTWLHVLIRLVNPNDAIHAFHSWIEFPQLGGLQIPLDLGLIPGAVLNVRATATEGNWLHLAVPLVSIAFLQALLPCSVHAESTLANRTVRSVVNLVNVQDTVCSIVPFGNDRYVLQSISPLFVNGQGLLNRVCLLELSEVGPGSGGTVYEVVDAYCDDCNEMECGAGCTDSIGWLLTLPGGVDSLAPGK